MADDAALAALLERATSEALDEGVRESDAFWSSVSEAARAVPVDEVLAIAVTFCRSDERALRATGAGLIAELCNPGRELVDEARGVLEPLLGRERDLRVIRIALHGLANVAQPAALPAVLPFASHPDEGVRLDATHALYSCAGEPPSAEAIAALIELSSDADEDVRDWATFGLGTRIETDDASVRDALVARLGDEFLDAREEAAVGLARRHDERAFESVEALLDADEVSVLTVEAAGHLADERFLRPLLELGEWWEDDSDVLRLAIARCDPVARLRFDERTGAVVDQIQREFEASLPGYRLDDVRAEPAFLDLTTELTLHWTDLSGNRREGLWSLEYLYGRPDVHDEPDRAAATILAQIRD